MHATRRDWLFLFTLGFVWGAAFMATSIATRGFAPFTLAGFRLVIGAIAVLIVLRVRGERLPGFARPDERLFWVAAAGVAMLANAMPFTLLAWAQRHIDSSLAGVLMSTVPLIVLPLAAMFVPGEQLTFRRIGGVVLGFGGVLVLVGPDALAGVEAHAGGDVFVLAIGACLLTAFGYASGSIVAKRAPALGLVPFGAAGLLIAAILVLPIAFVAERPLAALPDAGALLALVYLGIVPTGIAMLMLLTVISSAGPGFLSNVNYLVPLWALLLGVVVLGEDPSPRLGIALVMILAGIALSQGGAVARRDRHARG